MNQNITFLMFAIAEYPDKFMLVKFADTEPIQYLDAAGTWVDMPNEAERVDEVFSKMTDSGNMPQWVSPKELD